MLITLNLEIAHDDVDDGVQHALWLMLPLRRLVWDWGTCSNNKAHHWHLTTTFDIRNFGMAVVLFRRSFGLYFTVDWSSKSDEEPKKMKKEAS